MSLAFNVWTDSINEWLAPDFDVLEFDSAGSPRVIHGFSTDSAVFLFQIVLLFFFVFLSLLAFFFLFSEGEQFFFSAQNVHQEDTHRENLFER